METIIAVARVWKQHPNSTILLFPQWKENNGLIMMWEPVGQHGAGDPHGVVARTRLARPDEVEDVKDCMSIFIKIPS